MLNTTQLPLLPLILANVPSGLRRALAQEGIPYLDHVPGQLNGRFVLFDSTIEPYPLLAPVQSAIDVHDFRERMDEDPFTALEDERSQRCHWPVGDFELTEEIARVDQRAVRQQLMELLREQVERAGGIWLRVAAYPYPYRSAFNFRFDHDEFDPHDFDATLNAIAGHESACSHYICGSTHEAHAEELTRLRGSHIGSHGYWHHTYLDSRENLDNIRRGIEVLEQAGLEPDGFVAPHGRFHRGLLSALESLQVSHSSEFGLAYDDWPFFPAGSNVLQVPVHPVCLGLFLEAAKASPDPNSAVPAAVETAQEYFNSLAAARYQAGEPAFFYCHPNGRLGRFPQVLTHLLETVSEFAALWKVSLAEFARWWRIRSQIHLKVVREQEQFVIVADKLPKGFRFGVEYWRGEHVAAMPLDAPLVRFSPSALAFQRRKSLVSVQPVRVDGPHDWRTSLRRYLDWEKVTPLDAIRTDSFRGWVKRTLRRIKS